MEEKLELWFLGQFVSHPVLLQPSPSMAGGLETSSIKFGENLGSNNSLVTFQ